MFDDVFRLTSLRMERFADTVRDQFGQSIITDVFEPMLRDISRLQQLEEQFKTRIIEIDQLTEELRAIGNSTHG